LPSADTQPRLHVVLVAPEIPPNTGSIARLCAATAVRLHLIRPLGFSLDDRYLKRAGLDYWPHVDVRVYDDWQQFRQQHPDARMHFFSARATRSYLTVRYVWGDALVFGSETKGLPAALLAAHADDTYVIPISNPHVRSLNLSNAVSIVAYEALRQLSD
jgi:tRNA (cytidine/uridine-2'-O-)-methyltransferase